MLCKRAGIYTVKLGSGSSTLLVNECLKLARKLRLTLMLSIKEYLQLFSDRT
jgi:hypothetical protein